MMGIVKDIKEKAHSVANNLPNWRNCHFDRIVDPTVYSERRAFIDDKFTNLIVEKDEEDTPKTKSVATAPKTVKTEDKSAQPDKTAKVDKNNDSQPNAGLDFDPSDFNQKLIDKDTGEIVASDINELPPSLLAEQAIANHETNRTEQSNPTVVGDDSQAETNDAPVSYRENYRKKTANQQQATTEQASDTDDSTPVHPTRQQYRQMNDDEKKKVSDEANSASEKLLKQTAPSTSNDQNIQSLENFLPPEDEEGMYQDDFDNEPQRDEAPVEDKVVEKPVEKPAVQPSSPSKKIETYQPTADDKKVLDDYTKQLGKGWEEFKNSQK